MTITEAISTIGFPIVAFLLMYRFAFVALERNTEAIRTLSIMIEESNPGENADFVEEYKNDEGAQPFPFIKRWRK